MVSTNICQLIPSTVSFQGRLRVRFSPFCARRNALLCLYASANCLYEFTACSLSSTAHYTFTAFCRHKLLILHLQFFLQHCFAPIKPHLLHKYLCLIFSMIFSWYEELLLEVEVVRELFAVSAYLFVQMTVSVV